MVGIIVMILGALGFGLYAGNKSRNYDLEFEKEVESSLPSKLSSKKDN